MNKHVMVGIAVAALVLVGAGCKKETPPADQSGAQSGTATSTPEETTKDEAKTEASGAVKIDIRQDDESTAPPKALAGDKGEPAPSQNQPSSPSQPSSQPSPTTDAGATQQPVSPKVATTKSFTITATQWAFSPNTITVKQGDTVRMRVTSLDVSHGIMIPDYNINKVLNPNETIMFDFVADKKGAFTFRCSVQCGGGHPTMTGQLIVE